MKDRVAIGFMLGFPAIVVGILLAVGSWGPLQSLEWKTVDSRFQFRSHFSKPEPPPHLFLIAIDDRSTNDLGRWPFPRTYHADLMNELVKISPAVVAWDILFVDPDQVPESDVILVDSIKGFPSFVSGAVLAPRSAEQNLGRTKPFKHVLGDRSYLQESNEAQIPIPGLAKYGYFGFVNCEPMADGVRRFLPLVVSWKGEVYPSLALQTVLRYRQVDADLVTVQLGREIVIPGGLQGPEIKIPINQGGELFLNERRTIAEWPALSYGNLVRHLGERAESPEKTIPELETLKNSICLFGLTATGHGDSGATSLESLAPLVNLHLNGLSNILQEDFVQIDPPPYWHLFLYLAFLFLTGLMVRLPFYWAMGIGFLFFPIHYAVSVWWLLSSGILVPVVGPGLGIALSMMTVISFRYVREERDKRFIKRSLGAYLSRKIMTEVLSHPDGVQLGGTKKEITVLFCDIRNFTRYCEKRDPEAVLKVLNDYLQFMTDVILKYDGTLDKYIGDAIMAFWGAPQDQADHAQQAVCAAIEMRYAIAKFRSKQAEMGDELFECGIGIHTGEALVGNMGSMRHLNYTAIGATVNLASRLEALTKTVGARILISGATREKITGDFLITELGEVTMQGFTEPTKVFSVEAAQDLGSALDIAHSMKKHRESDGDHPSEPIFKPAPIPEDD